MAQKMNVDVAEFQQIKKRLGVSSNTEFCDLVYQKAGVAYNPKYISRRMCNEGSFSRELSLAIRSFARMMELETARA